MRCVWASWRLLPLSVSSVFLCAGTPPMALSAAKSKSISQGIVVHAKSSIRIRYDPTIKLSSYSFGGGHLFVITGGRLVTTYSRRQSSVAALVQQARGQAGINGTFFSIDSGAAADNIPVGPLLASVNRMFFSASAFDSRRCAGRPLVLIGSHNIVFVPFNPTMGGHLSVLRQYCHGASDVFLSGGWLVSNGVAVDEAGIRKSFVDNALDCRHRSAFGVDRMGRVFLAATDCSIDCARFALALRDSGAREAVLLDSGFSTALVFRGRLVAGGHSRLDFPSRAVPHALVLRAVSSQVLLSCE